MAFRKLVMLGVATLALAAVSVGCAEDSTMAPDPQDEAPVLAPGNVRASVINGGDIQVSWDLSSQPNVAGYNVYRHDLVNSAIVRLNPTRVSGASYTDATALLAREYEYRVTSVSARGNESSFAAVVIENRTPPGDAKGANPGEQD